jgi:acyl dehydratase
MGELELLQGRSFGPVALVASPDRVAAFAAATAADPLRWSVHVPPLFANAALFAAAPRFLDDPAVAPFTRSLIHSAQAYTWTRALKVGETVEVTGTVESVRARGSLHLVTFTVEASGSSDPWLRGTSLFLMADAAAAETEGAGEPAVTARPPVDAPDVLGSLPVSGTALSPYRCGASRADLVRYAAASGDWNPIHWDHESARGAGLPGTIVHGLLMAAWMANAVCRFTASSDPLRSLEVRFRSPLRPAVAAEVTGTVSGDGLCDLVLATGDERLVTGRIGVTP